MVKLVLLYGWDGININCLQNITISVVQNTIIIDWNKIVSVISNMKLQIFYLQVSQLGVVGEDSRR